MRLPFMKKFNIEEFEFSQSYLFFWDKVSHGTTYRFFGSQYDFSLFISWEMNCVSGKMLLFFLMFSVFASFKALVL